MHGLVDGISTFSSSFTDEACRFDDEHYVKIALIFTADQFLLQNYLHTLLNIYLDVS